MARWVLHEAHYLKVPGTYWEQKETDRNTGRVKVKQYPVPLYLNPTDPVDWNYKPEGGGHVTTGGNSFNEGVIIVCHAGKGEPRDIIFEGDPTPGMEPIDDEAKEISAKFKWSAPNFSDDEMSFAERQLANISNKLEHPIIPQEVIDMQKSMLEMVGKIAEISMQNAQLLQLMAGQPRRV
jgi:hypothetical protein